MELGNHAMDTIRTTFSLERKKKKPSGFRPPHQFFEETGNLAYPPPPTLG